MWSAAKQTYYAVLRASRVLGRLRLSEDLTFFISALASALTFDNPGGLFQHPVSP
jgi:hypothetical protein